MPRMINVQLVYGVLVVLLTHCTASAITTNVDLSTLSGPVGFTITGAAANDNSGWSVSAAGDVNGDGLGDVIVGAYGAEQSNAGIAYVIFGRSKVVDAVASYSNIELLAFNTAGSALGFAIVGAGANVGTGWSVSAAGDVNGDGIGDVIVGAPFADPVVGTERTDAGRSYVLFGRSKAVDEAASYANIDLLPLNSAGSPLGFAILGAGANDNSGYSVSAAGDVNGDGLGDVMVGAYQATPVVGTARGSAGIVYVIFGRSKAVNAAASYANIDLLPLNTAGSALGFAILGAVAGVSSYQASEAG